MNSIEKTYYFVPLSGSAYEIGRMQGNAIKDIPGWVDFLASGPAEWPDNSYPRLEKLYQNHCPGLLEEIQGLADALQVAPQRMIYNRATYLIPPRCSHFILLPQATENKEVLVGRSYDFGTESHDYRLCLTHVEGKYAHIGNSSMLLGRLDGMNEQGLVVTMSAGGIPVGDLPGLRPPTQEGLQFWAIIRSLLENCRNVEEALYWLKQIPCGGNPILILADSSAQAARVELFGSRLSVHSIKPDDPQSFLCAANHYTHPDMQPYQSGVMKNSIIREASMKAFFQEKTPHLTIQDAKDLLSAPYPQGLCCHFYPQYFGTLHSVLFLPQRSEVEICFGSPAINPWQRFKLQAPFRDSFQSTVATLPQEKAPEDFWA